jgi:2-phosphosulfolactate phosphatase
MEIRIDSLLEGAERAEGTVVIIDAYRAFTTAAIAFSRGVRKIILVAEVEEARDLRRRGLADVSVGEVDGFMPEGFDFGNSPFELSRADLEGKVLVQRTSAGTVGVSAATNAERIFAGSLVTANATAQVILRGAPDLVTIVAMGDGGRIRTDEDELCALYIRNLLQGRAPDRDAVRSLVLVGDQSQKYGDPRFPHFHAGDREIAVQVDSISFAIPVRREDGLLVARSEAV